MIKLEDKADVWIARDTYRRDFYKFCYEVLGYKDMNSEHRELCSFIVSRGLYKLVLMPRFTFKSCIATVGYTLWRLAKDYNYRVLIYSDAATKAEGFLGAIKNHISGKVANSRFRDVFGHWEVDPKQGKWNESQVVIGYRQTAHAEPSIDTGGIETSKIGFHYDLIVFDDIVSDKNITTKAQMDKVADCYKKALSLLKPGGEILMVGTRWHFGDLYGRLLAENRENRLFETFIRKSFDEGKYLFDNIGECSLTKERLDLLKRQQGSYVWSCLYQNSPVDDETATFKARDFAFGDVKPTDLYITATIDPAGQGEDLTAITVLGCDHKMDMYILDITNQKMSPSEMIDKVISLHFKYKFKIFGIETNFFRGMLKMELERRTQAEHQENPKEFPLFGIHEFLASSRRGENKHSRIRGLQPYHERGALKFPGRQLELLKGAHSELAYQMLQFPNAAHDDILDSLAYHLPLIRAGGVAKKKDVPYMSPAWVEKEAFKDEMKNRNTLPRRLRRHMAPLTFS